MKDIYVISDNQFFSLGVASILEGEAQVVPPTRVINIPKNSKVIMYIRDRGIHRKWCEYLSHQKCRLLVFLPSPLFESFRRTPPFIVSSMMTLRETRNTINCINSLEYVSPFENCSSEIVSTIESVSLGVGGYLKSVMTKGLSSKLAHYQHKKIIKELGWQKVNIHNIYNAQYIASVHLSVHKGMNY